MTRDDTAVVLLSGGIDSSVCLAIACRDYERVIPVHLQYGQQTEQLELRMADWQIQNIDRQHPDTEIYGMEVIDYGSVFSHFSEGVADREKDFGEMVEPDGRSSGYVPMRNLHFIATAAAVADRENACAVFHGAQGGDEEDYPDCRPRFMDSAAGAISRSVPDHRMLELKTPLIHRTKDEVISLGKDLGVSFEHTYSCYTAVESLSNPEPCLNCPACEERQEAFEKAGVEDPYAST